MAALLGLVLFTYFTCISTVQTADCLHLREQCINAANGCESVWNVVEDACNISEYLESFSRSDTELSFRQHRNPKDERHSEELVNDCRIAKQRCREDPSCFALYRSFQRACQADAAKCRFPMVNQECLSAWKELMKTVLGQCKCSESLQMRCIKIWKGIFNNRCLQYSQESQASAPSGHDDDSDDDDHNADVDDEKNLVTDTDNISMETKLQWGLSALSKQVYTTNRTCLDVNRECVEDEVCNKQLSLYLKVCSVNKKCNMEECQAALRFFYQNMPFEVAQMMIFCDCIQHDESCHRAKELLHGKPCAVTAVQAPSCLNVIHMCEENELCRKKYTSFRSKCWRHVTKKCYDDEACLETLIKDDMPCSANADCKAAYISNWGTMLHVECTCQNLPPVEQSLCKLFHHMLHSKSCFSELRQISIQKNGFGWVNTEMPGKKPSGAQLHSSAISGETVYIIAYSSCIALILGIVLLTLLNIRCTWQWYKYCISSGSL
ncbi:PREDICTED: GDNF family receptor alpha-like isoform X3 [Lepidothrix coronata]|uniref:GDNF family receptor alpha-like isoform X3 n=1 Tax=Lepidothrix coronata TaxID=321398 RepID=A0A6J0H7E0_9PASS|nr:PREDICTED: GDNF family receptor alpha-like isoform X3 [Lepidothrix coronata]